VATIPGVIVRFDTSPRIILIPAPLTEITIQDLHDTCTDLSDDPVNTAFAHLIESAGKENLGGSTSVGITATLQNAQVAFEERRTILSSGTASATDATGLILTDSGATFVSDGVVPGDTVVNVTTGAHSTAIKVAETTIETLTALESGQWTSGDSYAVRDEVQCDVAGGNLVAVDEFGSPITAIMPTVGTQVIRTSSSSATLSDETLNQQTRFLVENLRPNHKGFGSTFYVDPTNGSDGNAGTLPDQAFKTFAAAHTAAISGHDDVIVLLNNNPGPVTLTERITITKNRLLVRGPGLNFTIANPDDTGDCITVDGGGVELSGFRITATGATPRSAIHHTGKPHLRVQDVQILAPTGNGITDLGGDKHVFSRVEVTNAGLDGIVLQDTTSARIEICSILDAGASGIHLKATAPGLSLHNQIGLETVLHHNTTTQIEIDADVDETIINASNHIRGDGTNRIIDNGTDTHDEQLIREERSGEASRGGI